MERILPLYLLIVVAFCVLLVKVDKETKKKYKYSIQIYKDSVTVFNHNAVFVGKYLIDTNVNNFDNLLINDNQ